MVNSLHLWFRHDGTFDASKVARDFERILIGGLLVDADPRSAEVPFHGETSTAHFDTRRESPNRFISVEIDAIGAAVAVTATAVCADPPGLREALAIARSASATPTAAHSGRMLRRMDAFLSEVRMATPTRTGS
jgi:hypothetical protein